MGMPDLPVDWSAVNTALILGGLGYLWRQSRTIDGLRQALMGLDDRSGALAEIQNLRSRVYELVQTMTTLNVAVGHLTAQLDDVREGLADLRGKAPEWDGEERRHRHR